MKILRKQIHKDWEICCRGYENLEIPYSIQASGIEKDGNKFSENGKNYLVKQYPILDDVGCLDYYMYKIYEIAG